MWVLYVENYNCAELISKIKYLTKTIEVKRSFRVEINIKCLQFIVLCKTYGNILNKLQSE